MGGTVYAISVVLTNGTSGYVKFNGDGTWDWHIVQDVNEATMYRNRSECLDDYYKHIKNAAMTSNTAIRVDPSRCTIAECYNPWL